MEPRKIIVKDSQTQRTHTIMSAATTLGELKVDLAERSINYRGMTFNEGYSKTILASDDSPLPTNVTNRRTGEVTNELVFMLTNNEKNISSGINRLDVVAELKQKNLLDTVKARTGKNWTNCSTDVLADILADANAIWAKSDALPKASTENTSEYVTREEFQAFAEHVMTALGKLSAVATADAQKKPEEDIDYLFDFI